MASPRTYGASARRPCSSPSSPSASTSSPMPSLAHLLAGTGPPPSTISPRSTCSRRRSRMSDGSARLEVQDLCVSTEDNQREVVRGVSFRLWPGRTLGLVGESGSGKSTVALALLGYARRGLVIRSGSVLLDGDDVL